MSEMMPDALPGPGSPDIARIPREEPPPVPDEPQVPDAPDDPTDPPVIDGPVNSA